MNNSTNNKNNHKIVSVKEEVNFFEWSGMFLDLQSSLKQFHVNMNASAIWQFRRLRLQII